MPGSRVAPAPPGGRTGAGRDPGLFFAEVERKFEIAARRAALERRFNIAGNPVLLRFAGAALLSRITPALAVHSARSIGGSRDAALTIHAFDSASTGVAMPSPPWSAEDYGPHGEIRGYNDERYRTCFNIGGGLLYLYDRERRLGLFWIRDAARTPYWETGAPLRTIFHWWTQAMGRQVLHAAAVGFPDGGVLIAGPGGSGKSTAALACLGSELDFLGDDYTILAHGSSPRAHLLYGSAKLESHHMKRFPHLDGRILNPDRLPGEKVLLRLLEQGDKPTPDGMPLRALVLPRVGSAPETKLSALSAAVALRSMAPSCIFQLPGAGPAEFHRIGDLVRALPCFRLELGADLTRIPKLIARLLREVKP